MRDDDFARFAAAAEAVREARGTLRKRAIVAEYLSTLPPDRLPLGAVFFTGAPFPQVDPRTARAGWATLTRAALALLPWDEEVLYASARAVGDVGETLEKLFTLDPPRQRVRQATLASFAEAPQGPREPLTLAEVRDAFERLAVAETGLEKQRIVEETLLAMEPAEAKYFTRILSGGMRIGLAESLVEEAIAKAFRRPVADVRAANMVSGDIGETASLAREDRLQEAEFRMFHPLQFMLATPLDEIPERLENFVAEDKYDGVRAQLHASAGRAVLYSRTLDEAPEFPEIVDAAKTLGASVVLDGEVVAWIKGRPAPFAHLQRRLGRKDVSDAIRREIPVRYVAYDVLYAYGEPLSDAPFAERRRLLEGLRLREPLFLAPTYAVESRADVEAAFEAARARGNEGVMLKRITSRYEFGKRGKQWLKVKRPFATLDVVVTAAETGHGKRAGLLSDVTFAVRGEDGELLNVGKAYTGLTDAEIEQATKWFRRHTIERYGGVHLVEPEMVIEVAFDTVQKSARHKSGYALRFPRIARLRPDKRPEEIDTIGRVEELWRLALGEFAPAR